MNILLFHQYYLGKNDPGGSRWNEFTKYFSKKIGIKIDVIAGNIHYSTGKRILPKKWLNVEKIDENITLYRTWTYSGYNANFIGRLLGYFSYTFSSFMKAIFLKKPDVIIVTSPPIFVGLTAMIISKLKKIPFIFEIRDLWPESAVATGVLNNKIILRILYILEYKLYKHSQKIVVLTPAFKENIESRYPEFKNKIEIITNGADFSLMKCKKDIKNFRKELGWSGEKVFAYFGAHGVANDLMQVIEVANLLKENKKILFLLIGDGMQKKMLKEKAQEYKLENVQFIDSVPKNEVVDYISASDVCMAILKKSDTFRTVYPNKVFDYMSCKKPILVNIDGITKSLILKSKSGLYFEAGNIDSFKEAINNFICMSDSDLKTLGQNGYEYVKKYFNRENLAEKYFEIIKNVADTKKYFR
jgi:glycosyltransferase involved in cell wall biosynthesis